MMLPNVIDRQTSFGDFCNPNEIFPENLQVISNVLKRMNSQDRSSDSSVNLQSVERSDLVDTKPATPLTYHPIRPVLIRNLSISHLKGVENSGGNTGYTSPLDDKSVLTELRGFSVDPRVTPENQSEQKNNQSSQEHVKSEQNGPNISMSRTQQVFLTQNNYYISSPFHDPSHDVSRTQNNGSNFSSHCESPDFLSPSISPSAFNNAEETSSCSESNAKRKRMSSDEIARKLESDELTEHQKKRLRNNLACRKSRQKKQTQIREVEKTKEELKREAEMHKEVATSLRKQLESTNSLLVSLMKDSNIDLATKHKIRRELGKSMAVC